LDFRPEGRPVGNGRLRVEIHSQFTWPVAQRAACGDERLGIGRLAQRQASLVEIVCDARLGKQRLRIGADADIFVVRKGGGDKPLAAA